MTPEEIAFKFQVRPDVKTTDYRGVKVQYFVENNEDKYDLYFLVTDPNFVEDENTRARFSKMKMYLYDEGFLDSCFNDIDPDKTWKLHFLVQKKAERPIIKSRDVRESPFSLIWIIIKTAMIIWLVYSLLKWIFG